MRSIFLLVLAFLGLLSFVTWRTQPPAEVEGKVRLIRLSDNNPMRQAQVDLFNKAHPRLDVQLDPGGNDVDKVIVQSMGGVGPDLFDCFDAMQLSAFVQSGIAWDVTDELAKRGVSIQKDCFPGILPTAIYEGRTYGVPTNIAADGVWCHADLLSQAGIPIHRGPWKWSEFLPLAEKLTVRDANGRPERYGFLFEWWQWGDFFRGFGAHVYAKNGTKCALDSPQAIAALQFMHDLVYKYRVASSPAEEASTATAGGFGSGSMSVFGSKHAAMALGGRYWLAQLRTYKDLDLGVMEAPYQTVREFGLAGRAVLINKASPHREEALEYLVSMAGPDYNNLVNDQADGICAFKQYTLSPRFLLNPDYPNEAYNQVWRDITDLATPSEISPFISGKVAGDLIYEQLDLVRGNQKAAAQAMRDAAKAIDDQIQKNLANDPALKERFRQAGGEL